MKGKKKQVSTKNTPQPEGVSSGFSGDERAANAHPRDDRASESEIGYQVVEARVARIEASFQQMASVMGAMKSTLDKIEATGTHPGKGNVPHLGRRPVILRDLPRPMAPMTATAGIRQDGTEVNRNLLTKRGSLTVIQISIPLRPLFWSTYAL